MKVSVVISAYNEEKKIEDCLKSVAKVAREIIVIDNSSTDKTNEIAKKYTDKVYKRENYLMLNKNKNYGFSKATSPWVLSLDSDESLEEDLINEILKLREDVDYDGFYIPRKNIIFGKWIKNTGWYPDHQLRLFKKDKGRFQEKHIHELLTIDGQTQNLQNHIKHLNYDNISHFLEKTINIYTISEAESKILGGYEFDFSDLYKMPISEFTTRFFRNKGYKDGMHGLILSILMGFYHFIVFLRLWEKNNYKEDSDILQLFKDGQKFTKNEFEHWSNEIEMDREKNIFKKGIIKIKKKLRKYS